MNTNNDDGWIALNERRPTKPDADENGTVCYFTEKKERAHGQFDDYAFQSYCTHWRRSFPPPRIKTQAEIDADEDEKAWQEYSKDLRFRSAAESVEVHEGFNAGRASMRGKGEK